MHTRSGIMKRLLLFFTILTFTVTLFACGDDDTVIDQSPTFSHLIVDSREPTDNGELETYIKNKDEMIVVEVHFDNPSNAPINSVTINGQRYRTNRFEEGSSPTVVILNLTLRVTGETLYEVENFVYSDVNSVNIDTNNTYAVFVLKNLPSATLSNLEQGSEQLTMEIRVTDEDAVTLEESTTVDLYRGDTLIESKAILAGVINSVTFDDLLSNQTYSIQVTTDYNLDDGEGVVTDYLLLSDDTLTTLEKDTPSASISLDEISEEAIDFNVMFTDPATVLVEDGLDIVISQDDTIIDSLEGVDPETLDALSFTSLLNNNTYTISVYATYDLNDQTGIRNDILLAEREFTTSQRPLPSIQAELISITEDTMQLSVDDTNITTDVDLSNLVLTIYDNETDAILTETDIVDDIVTVEITGLSAHTVVRATITASFDLEDGQGLREGTVFEDTYQTTSNEPPTASIDTMTLTQTTAEFTMSINDPYNTVVEGSLEAHLYEDNVRIDTIILTNASGSYAFENQALYHDRSYRITVTTDYDLRDGDGITEAYLLSTFVKTEARPKAPEGSITNVEETSDGLVVHYQFYDYDGSLDTDGLTLQYHDESLTLDPTSTSITIDDYHKGVDYDFTLLAAYTIDQNYDTTLASETFTTTANQTPHIDIDVITTDESISGDIVIDDPDSVLASYTIDIYQNESVIHTQTTSNISVFDLLSDTEYQIDVTYTYDLNDTEGSQTATETMTVTTTEKTTPTLTVNDASITIEETSIEGTIDITDPDSTLESYVITLFKDDTEVESLSDQTTFTFTNLESDATYTIRIFKDYDLNKDGLKTDIQSDSITFTTEQYEVTNIDSITEDTIILRVDADYLASDFDLSTLKAYAYDESETLLAETSFLNDVFTFEIEGLYADQTITMHLEAEDLTGTVQTIQIETYQTEANTIPTADITTVTLAQTTIDFNVLFTDPNDTMVGNPVAYLYEDNSLLETLELDKDQTDYQFDNLAVYADRTYEIIIETDYDLRDETGLETDQFLDSYVIENVRDKAPEIVITDVTSDSSGIHINYDFYDYDTTLETDGLTLTYDGTTIILDGSGTYTITPMTNDITYELSIIASYVNHKGESQTVTETTNHQTDALTEPSVTLNTTKTTTTIDGTIDRADPNATITSTTISLYQGTNLIDSVTDTDTFDFTGLFSDESYTIEVSYTYDLNDDNGTHTETFTETISTDSYLAPTSSIEDINHALYEMALDIDITDTDATLSGSLTIALYDGSILIDSQDITTSQTVTFTELDETTTYTIIITGEVDQNLGTGIYTKTFVTQDETTPRYTPSVTLEDENIEQEAASVLFNLNDPFAITTSSTLRITLTDDNTLDVGESIYLESNMTINFNNLYSDYTYIMEVYATVDYQDGSGPQEILIYSDSFTTEAKTAPTASIDDIILDNTDIVVETTSITNPDDLDVTMTVLLYEDGILVDQLDTDGTSEVTFADAYDTNKSYTVKLVIDYDLNDSNGIQTDVLLDQVLFMLVDKN